MIYAEYIKTNVTAFIEKLKHICSILGINPEWLMIVMYAESRLNEKAVNPKSNATGLIQFMPSTAYGLGTTVTYLKTLSNVQQLDWVLKYFQPYKGRITSVYDLYKVVFFPVMLGKPKDWVLQTSKLSAETVARANPIIDLNKDLQITVGEFEMYVDTYLKKKSISKR